MKIKNILNELNLINEAVLDISEDVEYIYEQGGFSEFIKSYKNKEYPHELKISQGDDVSFNKIESKELKSTKGMQASLIKPVIIECGIFKSGNYYKPSNDRVQISISMNALNIFYAGEYNKVTDQQKKSLNNEITDFRIKASISHEISHWISDTLNNSHIANILFKAKEFGNADLIKLNTNDVNMTYFEIDAQIHGLLPIYKKHKDEWDSLSLSDVFNLYPPLTSINNAVSRNYGRDISLIWQKNLIKRMNREGLLGDRMRNFVK